MTRGPSVLSVYNLPANTNQSQLTQAFMTFRGFEKAILGVDANTEK